LSQSAHIISNDPKNPRAKISISALIKQHISVEPGFQIRFQGYAGDTFTKQVTITSHEGHPIEITGITSDLEDTIAYELTTKEEGKIYTLDITTPGGLKEAFKGNIVLQTTSSRKPEVTLVVLGFVQPEIRVTPQYLFFGIIDSSARDSDPKRLTRKVTISRARGKPFTLETIETPVDWITTETAPEEGKGGVAYVVSFALVQDKLPTGDFKETVTIHTNYDGTAAALKVIVEAKVK
jgi:hypothetical protein